MSIYQELSENDILFIGSSHVCKIGGGVKFETLEILQMLTHGVFKSIYNYIAYVLDRELFASSFLSNNNNFEIVIPMAYIQRLYESEFRELFPKGNNAVLWGRSSFRTKCIKGDSKL